MGYRQSRFQVVTGLGLALLACGGTQGPTTLPEATVAKPTEATEEQLIQAITKALNEYGPAIHRCWSKAAADDYQLNGRIVLGLELTNTDDAKVSVETDEPADPILTQCLSRLWQDYPWPEVFVAGDKIQLPPFVFVAPERQFVVATGDTKVETFSDGAYQFQSLLNHKNTGNPELELALLTLRDTLPAQAHAGAELLFVLSGHLIVGGADPAVAKPGTAVYIHPGSAHSYTPLGSEAVQALLLSVPAGAAQAFRSNPPTPPGNGESIGSFPPDSPTNILQHVADTPLLQILGGKATIRILLEEATTGHDAAYMGALSAEPGALVPTHSHVRSTEVLYVLEGQAQMRIDGLQTIVGPGDAVQIPAGVRHSAEIIGEHTFKAVQFYGPAGPEQRFKKGTK